MTNDNNELVSSDVLAEQGADLADLFKPLFEDLCANSAGPHIHSRYLELQACLTGAELEAFNEYAQHINQLLSAYASFGIQLGIKLASDEGEALLAAALALKGKGGDEGPGV